MNAVKINITEVPAFQKAVAAIYERAEGCRDADPQDPPLVHPVPEGVDGAAYLAGKADGLAAAHRIITVAFGLPGWLP